MCAAIVLIASAVLDDPPNLDAGIRWPLFINERREVGNKIEI